MAGVVALWKSVVPSSSGRKRDEEDKDARKCGRWQKSALGGANKMVCLSQPGRFPRRGHFLKAMETTRAFAS